MFRQNQRHLQTQMLSTIDALPPQHAKRLQEGWAAVFYREYFCRIDEKPYAVLFSAKDSRPNIPVNVLIGLEALKSGFNWSDEEMYDAFCFDLQVRFALGYRNLDEGHFDLRTVYHFRHRLSAYLQETGENLVEKSFETVTDEQIAVFRLKTGKVRMDSSQIASNICNLSRLHLLVEIIQRVHRMLEATDQTLYADTFAPYLKGTSGQYVYRVKGEDGPTHMQRIGDLMRDLLEKLASGYGAHAPYQMFQRVFVEHFLVEEGRVRLKVGKELSAASLNSPDDPEATFRTKNNRSHKGYVANITETCDPDNPLQVITKVQVAPNVTNDDDLLVEAVPSLKERLSIAEIHTDGAYNSDESFRVLRDNGITLTQTAIRGHAPHDHLGLDAFVIATSAADTAGDAGVTALDGEHVHSVQDGPITMTCPGGQTVTGEAVPSTTAYRRFRVHFDSAHCLGCSFQATCLARAAKSKPWRTLSFDERDREIARRRQRIAHNTQTHTNLRVGIEPTIASLKQPFNYDQLPVRGKFRVGMVLLGCAAMANVRRIHRYLTRIGAPWGPGAEVQAPSHATEAEYPLFLRALIPIRYLLNPLQPQLQAC